MRSTPNSQETTVIKPGPRELAEVVVFWKGLNPDLLKGLICVHVRERINARMTFCWHIHQRTLFYVFGPASHSISPLLLPDVLAMCSTLWEATCVQLLCVRTGQMVLKGDVGDKSQI